MIALQWRFRRMAIDADRRKKAIAFENSTPRRSTSRYGSAVFAVFSKHAPPPEMFTVGKFRRACTI
jgi:hypothetical protein